MKLPRHFFVQVLLVATCISAYRCQMEPTGNGTQVHARQAWIKTEKDVKNLVSKTIRKLLPMLLREIYKREIGAPCLGSLLQLTTGLKNTELWAYQLLDASGRVPEGFLAGTLTSLGNYEECLKVSVNKTKLKMVGQYCNMDILIPIPSYKPFTSLHITVPEFYNMSAPNTVVSHLGAFIHNLFITNIKVGLCVPSLCTVEDMNSLVQIIPEQVGVPWQFKVDRCEIKQPYTLTHPQLIVMCIFGVILSLVAIGTIVDVVLSTKASEGSSAKATLCQVIRSFSATSNAAKLANYTSPLENASFLHGIVFFIFLWITIADTFLYVDYHVVSNFLEALVILRTMFYEMALNRVVPLQALIYLFGFATTYKIMKSPDKSINLWKYLLKKYWRYTPTYALLCGVVIVAPGWGSGPSWYGQTNPMYENCKNYWWHNILYINNYFDPKTSCLEHTWVYAVMAQLHVMALCILVPLKRNSKLGHLLNLVLAIGGLVAIALTNVYYDLPPNEMPAYQHPVDRDIYATHTYYRLYTHLCFYCNGVFVGHLLAKNPDLKISNKTRYLMWLLTISGLLASLMVVHVWRMGIHLAPVSAAAYATFGKLAACAFLTWMTIGCVTGACTGARAFLSWRPFVFLSRLSFIAYFIHIPVMKVLLGCRKSHLYISELDVFVTVLVFVTSSFIVSYILHVFFEAPFVSLTDVLRRRCCEKTFTTLDPVIDEKPQKFVNTDEHAKSLTAVISQKNNV